MTKKKNNKAKTKKTEGGNKDDGHSTKGDDAIAAVSVLTQFNFFKYCEEWLFTEPKSEESARISLALYTFDPKRSFGMTEFCNSSVLAGKLSSLADNLTKKDELHKLFLNYLFDHDNIDNMCVRYLTMYLHSNLTVFRDAFNKKQRHKIMDRLISLWHSNMGVVKVKRDTEKIIAKHLIDVLVKNDYPVAKLLRRFIMNHSFDINFKYAFLTKLLRVTPAKEIDEELLIACYGQLERCLEFNQLATISSVPLVVLYEKFTELGSKEIFFELLVRTLTSVNWVQVCRLWLPHFSKANNLDVLDAMRDRLWAKLFARRDLDELTTIENWTPVECDCFAWLSVMMLYPTKARPSVVESFNMLQLCRQARQPSIKVLAMRLITDLEKGNELLADLCLKERVNFIYNNAKEEDADVRNAVLNAFQLLPHTDQLNVLHVLWSRSASDLKKCKLTFLTLLNANQSTCRQFMLSPYTLSTRLQIFLIDTIYDQSERSLREAAAKTIRLVITDLKAGNPTIFCENVLVEHLYNLYKHHRCDSNLSAVTIAQLLIEMEPHNCLTIMGMGLQNIWDTTTEKPNEEIDQVFAYLMDIDKKPVNAALSAFCYRRGFIKSDVLLQSCKRDIEQELRFGGSDMVGYCLTMPLLNGVFFMVLNNVANKKLTLRNVPTTNSVYEIPPPAFYPAAVEYDEATADLCMSVEQQRLMKAYANTLIENCATVVQLAKDSRKLDDIKEQHLMLIWSVLLRTYHKGVLQKCSVHFETILAMFAPDNVEVGRKMLNLTIRVLKLLRHPAVLAKDALNLSKSRDVAFAEILNSICKCFPSLIEDCVGLLLDAFKDDELEMCETTKKVKTHRNETEEPLTKAENDDDFAFFATYAVPIPDPGKKKSEAKAAAPSADKSAELAEKRAKVTKIVAAATSADKTTAAAPSADKTTAAATSADKTTAAAPSADKTTAAAPSADKTTAAATSADKTTAAAPSADKTTAAATSADKTTAAAPSADKTKAAAPSADKTTAAAPSADKTTAAATSADKTTAAAPSADKTKAAAKAESKEGQARMPPFTIEHVRSIILTVFCRLLESSELDLSDHYLVICHLLIDHPFMSQDFKFFSMSCRAAVALINSMFKGCPTRMPLAIFLGKYRQIFYLLCDSIQSIIDSAKEGLDGTLLRCLSVLLTPFERLIISEYPFDCYVKKDKTCIRQLLDNLKIVFGLNPSLISRYQIINVIVNFIPQASYKDVRDKLCRANPKTDVFTNSALSYLDSIPIEKEAPYKSMIAEKRKAGEKLELTNSEWMLNDAVKHSKSSLVSERLLAAELFVTGYKLLAKENPTLLSTRICSDMSSICRLLEDEDYSIRTVACMCSIFINLKRKPNTEAEAAQPLSNKAVQTGSNDASVAVANKVATSMLQNIALQLRLPLDAATISGTQKK